MGWRAHRQDFQGRSPLKEKPLRYPAQSLDEHIDRTVTEQFTPWVIVSVFAVFWAGWEWFRWLVPTSPKPYLATATAVYFIGSSVRRYKRVKRELAQLKLGRDGERAVAQYLDGLREKHYRVFHDVLGGDFNLDHVIISPHGIYTVETKTHSKPTTGKAIVRLENGKLFANGRAFDRDPIEQAKAQAKWLRELLAESTGRSFPIQPVVVFPGWFVEPMPRNGSRDVWVLHPKALPGFIGNEPVILRPDEVHLVAFHLSRYIRTAAEESLKV